MLFGEGREGIFWHLASHGNYFKWVILLYIILFSCVFSYSMCVLLCFAYFSCDSCWVDSVVICKYQKYLTDDASNRMGSMRQM